MNEQIKKVLAENRRTKDPFLDIGNCGLTEWPEELFEHVWIETLVAGYGYKEEWNWSFSQNQGHPNQLKTIPKKIGSFKKLTTLDLSGNQLSRIEGLDNLASLTTLDLSRNQLIRIEGLENLASLTTLYLFANQIGKINLKKTLHTFPKLESIYLTGNPIKNIPKAICDHYGNCLPQLKDYQIAVDKGQITNNKAKILLIGNGRVGKTCLAKRLLKEKDFNTEEESTHAITIGNWAVKKLDLAIWDFGGQGIYHATHQLFMRCNAVYLLVWDWKSEQNDSHKDNAGNQFPNHPLSYWLEYWRILGKESPLIIVQNKGDIKEHQFKELPAKARLREKFQLRTTDFIEVSAQSKEGLKELQQLILKKIKKLPEVKQKVPELYVATRTWMEACLAMGQRRLRYLQL